MEVYPHVVELIARWEAESAQALPSDAVLLREKIRDLREALWIVAPAGWVLMPRVLTEEMLQAGYPADDAQTGYEAMIAARPEAP